MRNNKKNNIIMREFLQKFVDWIAMLLRWLYAAPNDAVQCQHDTRVEKLRDVSVRHVGRGLNSSELVKGRMLLAECKSFIRQRLKRMAVGVVLVGLCVGVSAQTNRNSELNLNFHSGLNGWKLYYGAALFQYNGTTPEKKCSELQTYNETHASFHWGYEELKNARDNVSLYGNYTLPAKTIQDSYNPNGAKGKTPGAVPGTFEQYFSEHEIEGGITQYYYQVSGNQNFFEVAAEMPRKNQICAYTVHQVDNSNLRRFQVYASGETTPTDEFIGKGNKVGSSKTDNINLSIYGVPNGQTLRSFPKVYPKSKNACRLGSAGHHCGNEDWGGYCTELAKGMWASNQRSGTDHGYKDNGLPNVSAAERMVYEFEKKEGDDVIFIHYLAAAICPSPEHWRAGSPRYSIKAFYSNSSSVLDDGEEGGWNEIGCGNQLITSYDMRLQNGKRYCDGNEYATAIFSTGFTENPNINNPNYDDPNRGWRTVAFPIKDYPVGTNIAIEVITNDCNYGSCRAGGHACWVYFTGEVLSNNLLVKYCSAADGLEATASAGYDYYLFGYKRPGYDPVFPLAIQEYKTDANGNVISAGNILKAVPNGVNRTFLATLESQPAGTELVCYMSNSKERLEAIKSNPIINNGRI